MFNQTKPRDRFARVIQELNKSAEPRDKPKPSSEISLFGRSSIGSSQRSTKYTYHANQSKLLTLNEQEAIEILLEKYEVLVNRLLVTVQTEFIPTSKGLKYVLVLGDGDYINLSWLHSAQELQKNKILILHYSMQKIKYKEKPNIESLVIEFSQQKQQLSFLSAVLYFHEKYHDEDIQKIYHKFCSQ